MRGPGRLLLAAAWLLLGVAVAAPENLFQRVGFDQRLGNPLPMETLLQDSAGHSVRLGELFGQRPVLLVLGYYHCPNLCSETWRGLLESLRPLGLAVGRDFDVVAISIDPRETPAIARDKRRDVLRQYDRPGSENGWHFLTGSEPATGAIAEAAGFRYVYDPALDQYAHAAGLIVTTPQGDLSRYLYGVRFPRTDLRLALVESSDGVIGSPIDQLLLLCYQYDPANGRYGPLIMNLLRGAGLVTVSVLLGFVLRSWRRERRNARPRQEGTAK